MAKEDDFLVTAALAGKALATAQQALAAAQQAAARGEPVPLDTAALVADIVRAMSRMKLPAAQVTVAAAEAPQVNVSPVFNVEAAPPAVNNFAPQITVDVPEQAPPVVNVAGPVVTVDSPVVHVAAPSVAVNVPSPVPAPRLPWQIVVNRDMRTNLITSADLVPLQEAA